jgi:hypothetical protein
MKIHILKISLILSLFASLATTGCQTGEQEEKAPTSSSSPTGGAATN